MNHGSYRLIIISTNQPTIIIIIIMIIIIIVIIIIGSTFADCWVNVTYSHRNERRRSSVVILHYPQQEGPLQLQAGLVTPPNYRYVHYIPL